MEVFIAYRGTGEDPEELKKTMGSVCASLDAMGVNSYCTLFDESALDKSKNKLLYSAFDKIDNSDALVVLVNNSKKSEGMLLEVGYAIAKKKRILLLINKNIKKTHLRELVSEIIEFEDLHDLRNKISEFKKWD